MSGSAKASEVREIFLRAVDIPDRDACRLFLDEACGTDTDLRTKVEELLAAREHKQPNLLDAAVQDSHTSQNSEDAQAWFEETNIAGAEFMGFDENERAAANRPIDVSKHPQIGPYKLLEKLGHGGMGTVYMAQQSAPIKRKVALKIIKPGMDTEEVIARFEAERQALALMDHPNIARVIDGGSTEDGRPFFVMELVRGVSITDFCQQEKPELRERLELFIDVCRAIRHAHQKGIIHRDLKPSNLMVTMHDHLPVVKVIDFGVAKALNQELTDRTLFTQFSQVLGTPLYMSPEQAQLSGLDIDTRSDIYSLGVVLYELLTGTTPFDREKMSRLGMDGIRKLLHEQEPERPSSRVSTLKAADQATINDQRAFNTEDISRQLKGELDWIVMKALEKDRERRYETATDFADDVQRYLDDEPVHACPPSMVYRVKKYTRRHKGLIATATVLVVTLVASTIVSGIFAVQAQQDRKNAVTALEKSEQNFDAALTAIDKLLQHASASELVEIPQAQRVRKKILEDVLDFYERFTVTTGDSPQLRLRAAFTRRRLAGLAADLRELDAAEAAFDGTIDEVEALLRNAPNNKQYREHLAVTLTSCGYFQLHKRADPVAARRYFERAKTLTGQLVAQDPKNDSNSDRHVSSLVALSYTYKYTGQPAQQLDLLMQAQEYSGKRGFSVPLQKALGQALASFDSERAETLYRSAIAKNRELVESEPIRARRSWHCSLLLDAAEYLKRRCPQDAESWVLEAEAELAALTAEFPAVPEFSNSLSRSLNLRFSLLSQTASVPDQKRIVLQYLKKFPDSASVHHAHAELLADEEEGISALSTAIEQFPEQSVYYEVRSMLLVRQNRVDEALADLRNAFLKAPDASEFEERVYRMVREMGRHGHWTEALAAAKIADQGETDWYYVDLALCEAHLGLQQYNEALTHINAAIAMAPNQGWLYKRRAQANVYLNHLDDALADLNMALESNPGGLSGVLTFIPLNEVAKCDNAEFRRGILQFANRVVERDNHSPATIRVRASLRLALGEWALAKADIDTFIASGNSAYFPLRRVALSWLSAGDLPRYGQICAKMVEFLGDSQSASDAYFTAWTCAAAPNAIDAYEPVISVARRAVNEEPNNPAYSEALGAILMRAGHYEEAKRHLNSAAQANATNEKFSSSCHYFLAMTEHYLGNSHAARENLLSAHETADIEFAGPPTWDRRLTLPLLRHEAKSLLESDDTAK